MKVAPKNMVFSKSHSLSDRLALVISYDSIGYLGCIISICQMLVGNPKYRLGPIEATWAKQQDKEHLQKKERESTNKGKGLCSKAKKRKLELERIENAIAK